jgi:4a-hydroxytetrahydrobiopterin dehydratase
MEWKMGSDTSFLAFVDPFARPLWFIYCLRAAEQGYFSKPTFPFSPMWQELDNQLTRDFVFADFSEAFAFMTRVALVAEKMDHHPWWSNVYNQVTIRLSTHDAGNTVTEKDRALAAAIDQLVSQGAGQ